MRGCQTSIEGRQCAVPTAGQMAEIGVGDLPIADESVDDVAGVLQVIRPEDMTSKRVDPGHRCGDIARRISLVDGLDLGRWSECSTQKVDDSAAQRAPSIVRQ